MGDKEMKKHKCNLCSYVYDPEKGHPVGGVKSKTDFEDIPNDWLCPVCGAGKDSFEEVLAKNS